MSARLKWNGNSAAPRNTHSLASLHTTFTRASCSCTKHENGRPLQSHILPLQDVHGLNKPPGLSQRRGRACQRANDNADHSCLWPLICIVNFFFKHFILHSIVPYDACRDDSVLLQQHQSPPYATTALVTNRRPYHKTPSNNS
jgi:hypothetical protein